MQPLPHPLQIRRDRSLCRRIFVSTAVLIGGFSLVTYQLVQIQIRQHETFSRLAAERYQGVIPLKAQRGSIRDRAGEYLAFDEKTPELHTDRNHLFEPDLVRPKWAKILDRPASEVAKLPAQELLTAYHQYLADRLSEKLDLPASEVLAKLTSPRPVSVIQRDLPLDLAASMKEFLASHHIIGVYLREGSERRLASTDRLTLTIGATKEGEGGIWGIERLCDSVLRGKEGKQFIEKDRRGIEQPLFRGETIPAQNGADVFLTIDMNLQDTVEALVEQAYQQHNPKSVAAILTDPATGSILAMACRPHLDLTANSGNWRNIPVADAYEPGSVMKIIAFAGALDAGVITPNTPIDCGKGLYKAPELGSADIHDDEWNLGLQPAWGVLAHSSNIGTYKIARKLGWEAFDRTLRRFGFGATTGLGLGTEPNGYWLPVDHWTAVDFSRISFGYGITATALQQVMAYGAIANGGVLMKPRLIEHILHKDGTELEICRPEPVRQACTARTAQQIAQMLEQSVTQGTGSRAKIDGVRVAGKTGTRRIYDAKRKAYRDDQYLVSFAGFAPVEKPRVACVVMVDNPKAESAKQIRGGLVAAPLFADLVRATLDHLEVRLNAATGNVAQTNNAPQGGDR
jgi:cell division protein FtsI/penicillin-binding protein 2